MFRVLCGRKFLFVYANLHSGSVNSQIHFANRHSDCVGLHSDCADSQIHFVNPHSCCVGLHSHCADSQIHSVNPHSRCVGLHSAVQISSIVLQTDTPVVAFILSVIAAQFFILFHCPLHHTSHIPLSILPSL